MALNQGFEYREQVGGRGAGVTVLDYLTRNYRHSSQEEWKRRLVDGEVVLDGLRACGESILQPGQWLRWRRPPWEEPEVPLTYGVLYEDADLLAVAKPCGLPTVPAGGFLEHTLLTLVRKRTPEAVPIHRLGRGTSGVVLFARSPRARSGLCAALRGFAITKVYRALANGVPARDRFSVEVPIGPVPHPRLGAVHAASPSGKHALSRVRILERRSNASLAEVVIETGRPHQIRIHLAAAGHPLVGDPLYASGGTPLAFNPALPGETGYLLHAERLCLRHPVTGLSLELSCAPPPPLRLVAEGGNQGR